MLKWLDGILDEEDLTRIKMGRFSEADEREIKKPHCLISCDIEGRLSG
jgi:hypothetical protein